jgi:hypothetical protein
MEAWRKIFNERKLAVSIYLGDQLDQWDHSIWKNQTLVGIVNFYITDEIHSSMVTRTKKYRDKD